ncbi:hypothetical protein ACFL2J_07695 [Candidatus Omnitrophota bacterium]
MKKIAKILSFSRVNKGAALISVFFLIFVLLALGMIATRLTLTLSGSYRVEKKRVNSFVAAEAGVHRALFIASSTPLGDWPTTFAAPGYELSDSALTSNSSYVTTILYTGPTNLEVDSVGTDSTIPAFSRKIRVLVRPKIPEAFEYTIFADTYMHYDNHMQGSYGLTIESKLWSNGDLKIDRGLSLIPVDPGSSDPFLAAVGAVQLNEGPAGGSIPPCLINGITGNHILSQLEATGTMVDGAFYTDIRDGDNSSLFFSPNFGDPIPEIKPMPTPDYAALKTKAIGDGAYFATAAELNTFLTTASAKVTIDDTPQEYRLPVPTPSDPNYSIKLGIDNDGVAEDSAAGDWVSGATDIPLASKITTIGSKTDPVIIYSDAAIAFDIPTDQLLKIYGTLVSETSITIHAPLELYASQDANGDGDYDDAEDFNSQQPAMVSAGRIKTDDKDHTDGIGGPVHFEGIIYSEAEIHMHQSDQFNSVYLKGSEICDTVHNCEWFSFVYDDIVQTTSYFTEASPNKIQLELISWEEVPAT